MESEDFKWDDSSESAIVFRSVDAIAVYRNKADDIVIRQQSRIGEDDSFIVLPEKAMEELILALQNELKD